MRSHEIWVSGEMWRDCILQQPDILFASLLRLRDTSGQAVNVSDVHLQRNYLQNPVEYVLPAPEESLAFTINDTNMPNEW